MQIFVDSGYWIALLSVRDRLHLWAITLPSTLPPHRLVTTEMVLTEVLNEFSKARRDLREGAAEFVQQLYREANLEIVPQTPELFAAALELYANRPDKDWSLTDCASFALCYERGITEAFAYDRHFAQAGITPLLRDAEAIG